MAKGGGSAPAPSPAPAPAAPVAPSQASKTAAIQSIADIRDVDVVEWGNGEPASGSTESPPAMARGGILDDAPAKVTPQKGEPDHPDELAAKPTSKVDEPETETAADEPAKKTPAEKRQRALDNLASERRARTLEQELKDTRAKLEAGEKLTLGELLKARGINKDDLLEKLLTGADDLGLPAKLEGDAAALDALQKKIDALEARDKERAEQETQRKIDEGIRTVAEHLKDVGVPLIESLGAYGDVMNEAYDLWVRSGKDGIALDHLPTAAEKVEKALRAKHPRLAALADAAEKAGKASPAAAAAAITRPGITRRAGASPQGKPTPLPSDPLDRDVAIKKEMGWT